MGKSRVGADAEQNSQAEERAFGLDAAREEALAAAAAAEEQVETMHEDAGQLAASALQLLNDALAMLDHSPREQHAKASVDSSGLPASDSRRQESGPTAAGSGSGTEHGAARWQGAEAGSGAVAGVGAEGSVESEKLVEMEATIRRLQAAVADIAGLVRDELSARRGAQVPAVAAAAGGSAGDKQTPAPGRERASYPATPVQAGDELQTAAADVRNLAERVDSIRQSRSPHAVEKAGPGHAAEDQLREAQRDAAEAQRKLALLREWVADHWPLGIDQDASETDADAAHATLTGVRAPSAAFTGASGARARAAAAAAAAAPASPARFSPPRQALAARSETEWASGRESPDTPTLDGGPMGVPSPRVSGTPRRQQVTAAARGASPISSPSVGEMIGAADPSHGRATNARHEMSPAQYRQEWATRGASSAAGSGAAATAPAAPWLQRAEAAFLDPAAVENTRFSPSSDAHMSASPLPAGSSAPGAHADDGASPAASADYDSELGRDAVAQDHTLLPLASASGGGASPQRDGSEEPPREGEYVVAARPELPAAAHTGAARADAATSAELRQCVSAAGATGAGERRVCLAGGAFMLDGPLGVGARGVRVRGLRNAVVMGRWILEAGASGLLRRLKMVNLPAAPPPSIGTPLTPPTLRSWVCPPPRAPLTTRPVRSFPQFSRRPPCTQPRVCVYKTKVDVRHETMRGLYGAGGGGKGTDGRPGWVQMQACVLVWGGPWDIECSEVRSSGGVAIRCFKQARVRIRRCGVGGLGMGRDLASIAVSVQEAAYCSVAASAVEKVGPTIVRRVLGLGSRVGAEAGHVLGSPALIP